MGFSKKGAKQNKTFPRPASHLQEEGDCSDHPKLWPSLRNQRPLAIMIAWVMPSPIYTCKEICLQQKLNDDRQHYRCCLWNKKKIHPAIIKPNYDTNLHRSYFFKGSALQHLEKVMQWFCTRIISESLPFPVRFYLLGCRTAWPLIIQRFVRCQFDHNSRQL